MRWTRTATILLAVALLAATALCAQTATQPPQQRDMSAAVIVGFVVTWTGLLITILTFSLTLRRDRLNWQDRVDGRTKEVLRFELVSKEFCDQRDDRIREIVHLEYEMKVANVEGSLSQLTERVEALSRRVANVPVEIREDVRRAVQDGVSDATARLTKESIRSTMVLPDRERT